MTPAEVRAAALHGALLFATANNPHPTMADIAGPYAFFVNLIRIGLLEDNTTVTPVQQPRTLPPRPVADLSKYKANVVGG